MILKRKILLLFVLVTFSATVFAQKPPTKEQVKAENEAKEKEEKTAKEKAEADAKIKAYEEAKAKEEAMKKAFEEENKKLYQKILEALAEQKDGVIRSHSNVNVKAEAFYSAAMSQINVKHVAWIKQNAKRIFVDKMDDLSFKVMARHYGKNEGLSEEGIEGLQVLLLNEAYMLENKSFNLYNEQLIGINSKKNELLLVYERLDDSKHLINNNELDSINLIINAFKDSVNELTGETDKLAQTTLQNMPEKKKDNIASVSDLSITRAKLVESITGLYDAQNQQKQQMFEIERNQLKIIAMLDKMADQVAAAQENIIQNLK